MLAVYKTHQPRPHGHFVSFSSGETHGRGDEVENTQ